MSPTQMWGTLAVVSREPAISAASAWRADLERYPPRPWLQQSVWAVGVYRFGRWNDRSTSGIAHRALDRVYWCAFYFVEVVTKISITKRVEIGPGLRIHHFGPVIINERSRIGARCTLEHGVTLGTRYPHGPAPVIGDDVQLGAYAQVLGGVEIGNGAKIGAMSVVLEDVPAGATAVGVPARVVDAGSTAR